MYIPRNLVTETLSGQLKIQWPVGFQVSWPSGPGANRSLGKPLFSSLNAAAADDDVCKKIYAALLAKGFLCF